MKQYLITGLCKREYRGKGRDTTLQEIVEADSKEKAAEKYEKANPEYSAASVAEQPYEPKKKKSNEAESDTDNGMDIASEHDENG